MTSAIVVRVLEAWLACAVLQAALWMVAQRTKNAGIVDVGWAQSFTLIVLIYGLQAGGPRGGWLPLAIVIVAWSTRLTCYLLARGAATGREEGRYAELRRRWGAAASTKLFVFFQAQAALSAILSLAFVVPFVSASPGNSVLRGLGFFIAAVGIAGESISDAQLRAFKRRHPSAVCDAGLWSWSRHPNYFFEWCVWLGFAVYGLAFAPAGLIALLGQAIILGSILGVTGIPPTEKQALRSKGEAYRQYQTRVSRFIPMPPKRSEAQLQPRGRAS
jgi:steroid 5-alpha reductase family enzyme